MNWSNFTYEANVIIKWSLGFSRWKLEWGRFFSLLDFLNFLLQMLLVVDYAKYRWLVFSWSWLMNLVIFKWTNNNDADFAISGVNDYWVLSVHIYWNKTECLKRNKFEIFAKDFHTTEQRSTLSNVKCLKQRLKSPQSKNIKMQTFNASPHTYDALLFIVKNPFTFTSVIIAH